MHRRSACTYSSKQHKLAFDCRPKCEYKNCWRCTGIQISPCWGPYSADAMESQLFRHCLSQHGLYCV